jgi:glycosyltransferase involved in cell wall biosynthesis
VRSKYGIPTDAVVFIYGGIISRAQGVNFIESVFLQLKKSPVKNAYFLLIGSGNESERLNKYITELRLGNVKMMPFLPKKEYDEIQGCADVGMIFLDKRFTIANIPSRTLSYMDMGLAIVAGTDTYTDYRELVEKNEVGLWCSSDNPVAMVENIRRLTDDKIFRDSCSKNSRNYLLNNWTTEIVYNIIRKSFDSFKKK